MSTKGRGIGCPRCGCTRFSVVYVRRGDEQIRRRRECEHCGRRITTIEQIQSAAKGTRVERN